MLGWRSGQCKVKVAVLSQFTYYWTESHMIPYVENLQWESIPIPILLFPLPYQFLSSSHYHSHSRGNPTGSQLFPFPCTSLTSEQWLRQLHLHTGASTNGGLGDGSPTISKMGGFATKGLHWITVSCVGRYCHYWDCLLQFMRLQVFRQRYLSPTLWYNW